MALIICPECGGKVSDSASSCPHCGYSLANIKHCTECNAVITENEAVCPECGHPTPWSRKCPECGNYVLSTKDTCSECGFDMISHYGRVSVINSNPAIAQPLLEDDDCSWDEEEKPSKKKWFIIGGVVLILVVVLGWWFMGGGNNPTMKCEIQDHHGTIFGENKKPLCSAMMYSDSEPFHITFESSVNIFGTMVTEVYLRQGQVYSEFPSSYNIDSYTPIADYVATKNQGKWTFTFSKVKAIDPNDIPLERKLRQAKTKEEVVNLINGTTWHCTNTSQLSGWLQVSFNDGHYTCYSAAPSDGEWTQTGSGTYSVSEGHFANTGEKYVCIEWKCDFRVKNKSTLPCEFRFFPTNGQIDVYCHTLWMANRSIGNGSWYDEEKPESSEMHLGEYKW